MRAPEPTKGGDRRVSQGRRHIEEGTAQGCMRGVGGGINHVIVIVAVFPHPRSAHHPPAPFGPTTAIRPLHHRTDSGMPAMPIRHSAPTTALTR